MGDARDPFLTRPQQNAQTLGPSGTTAAPMATSAPGPKKGSATSLGPTKRGRGGIGWGGMFGLIFPPWLLFATLLCLFSFCYHQHSTLVWFTILGFLCLAAYMLSRSGGGEKWYLYQGVLIILACVISTVLGLYNYHEYLFSFWAYDSYQNYNNVLPSEPAAAHADAGKMIFSSDARVDTTKAVGYKSNDVYCVAPVLDDTMSSRIEFWAAGVNCCGPRADFRCDDSWNPRARSGVVVLDNDSFLPSHHDLFMKAVKLAEAAFDVVSAEQPIFVRWVVDPQEVQDRFWADGIGFILVATCLYLVISVIFGSVLSKSSGR